MCVGKDLKPFDCKEGPARCDHVTIPTMSKDPSAGKVHESSSAASRSSREERDEALWMADTIILAFAGAIIVVVIVGTVISSTFKRAGTDEHRHPGCQRADRMHEAGSVVQTGAGGSKEHQASEDMEGTASVTQPLL